MENQNQNQNFQPKIDSKPKAKVRVAQKKNTGSTIAIVALSILLGLSLVFGITAAFFTASKTTTGDVTLGDPVNINITQGGASVTSLTFDGTALPGTVYDQVIGISIPADSSDCVVRGKLSITRSDGGTVAVTATTDANWTKGDDDYYYYNGVLKAEDTASFITAITIPTTLTNTDAGKVYTVSVTVESIQYANGAASEVWTTAPSTWTTAYGSGATA